MHYVDTCSFTSSRPSVIPVVSVALVVPPVLGLATVEVGARLIAEAGVERLDALVITHAQSDHEGAALTILRHMRVRLIVNGGAERTERQFRALYEAAGFALTQVVATPSGFSVLVGRPALDRGEA